MKDNETLLNLTVGEFRLYCKRMCGLCNIKKQHYMKDDFRTNRNERAVCCPFLQARAYLDLKAEGGMDKVSREHSKRVLQLAETINISNRGGNGTPVYKNRIVLAENE